MEQYKKGVNNLCKVEQDLATGVDKDGVPVDEPLKIIMSSLFDRNVGWERERERERERDRQTDRQTDRWTDRQRQRGRSGTVLAIIS